MFPIPKVISEGERGVIFKHGKFFDIIGPGLFLVSCRDRLVKIKLKEHIPDWQKLRPEELRQRIKQTATQLLEAFGRSDGDYLGN